MQTSKTLPNVSYIGIGNELHLCHYDRNRDKTAHTCLAQRLTDKIHGIQFVTKNGSTYDVLVYGGREFMRISVVEVSCKTRFFWKILKTTNHPAILE